MSEQTEAMLRGLALCLCLSLCLSHVSAFVNESSYCDKDICEDRVHIACNNSGNFVSTCGPHAEIVEVTPDLRDYILDWHNKLRNRVAGGELNHLPTAVRMAKIRWSKTLEHFAELNVRQCALRIDACRNTRDLHYVGQSVGSFGTTGKAIDTRSFLEKQMTKWSQVDGVDEKIVDNYQRRGNGPDSAHFTQMVKDRTPIMGCAMSRNWRLKKKYIYLTCNYARANILNEAVYEHGPTGSNCTTGRDNQYTNLCTTSERYDEPAPVRAVTDDETEDYTSQPVVAGTDDFIMETEDY